MQAPRRKAVYPVTQLEEILEHGVFEKGEEVDRDRTWTIAELAAEFDVTPRTIRFYEDQGLIKPKREGLNRIYSYGDRLRLKWILRGKRVGFSLAEIAEMLELYHVDKTGVIQLTEVLKRGRRHIASLEKQRQDLEATIAELKWFEEQVANELKKRGR
jgi:DNA-binding transcriptional MerR regulator